MECSCVVSPEYYGEEECLSERERKAAKQHKCFECRGTINKGETYWFHTIFGDGTTRNFKICQECESILNIFFSDGWVYGSSRDDLFDYLHENWQEDLPSSCISKLPPSAKHLVCDYLQEYQEA